MVSPFFIEGDEGDVLYSFLWGWIKGSAFEMTRNGRKRVALAIFRKKLDCKKGQSNCNTTNHNAMGAPNALMAPSMF